MNGFLAGSTALVLLGCGAVCAQDSPWPSASNNSNNVDAPNVPAELSAPPAPASAASVKDEAAGAGDSHTVHAGDAAGVAVADPPVPVSPDVKPALPPKAQDVRSAPPMPAPAPAHSDKPTQRFAGTEPPVHVPSTRQWAGRATERRMVVAYDQSTPTIDCAPQHVCDIELQPGEVVQGAPFIGDTSGWKVLPATSGSGSRQVTHVIVKAAEPGLDTNLIVTTDRHTYHLRLLSTLDHYVSSVSFSYPPVSADAVEGIDSPEIDMPTVGVEHLNFDYRITLVRGKPTLRPLRAMDDGAHTYISMNREIVAGEGPMLLAVASDGSEKVVTYRLEGNLYVTEGTFAKLALVSMRHGVSERVELVRDPCRRRGWLGVCWDMRR